MRPQRGGSLTLPTHALQEAVAAVREMDNHTFDKSHTLRVYRIDELDRLASVPEEYTQPEKAQFDEQVHARACSVRRHHLRASTPAAACGGRFGAQWG